MYIDLSVALKESTPVYPGDEALRITAAGTHEASGYQDHIVHIGTHVGTHMDAPAHMIAGGKTLDQYPIGKFAGRGVYIKVEGEFSLTAIQRIPLQEGDIVLFHTGMSDKYFEPVYFENYPVIPENVAHYLVAKKISIVGMDMCSPDAPPFSTHKILLAGDVLIIENLVNVEALAGREFKVHAFPMKLALDAAPVRVVAEILNGK